MGDPNDERKDEMTNFNKLREELMSLSVRDLKEIKKKLNIRRGGKSKNELIDAILSSVEEFEVSLDEIKAVLEEYKFRKGSKKHTRPVPVDSLILKESLDALNRKLDDLNEKISKLTNALKEISTTLSKIRESISIEYREGDIDHLFLSLKKLNVSNIGQEQINFDNIIKKLDILGIDSSYLFKIGGLAVLLDHLISIANRLDHDKNLEDFYNLVKSEGEKFKEADGTIPIYKIRRELCEKMKISKEEFDKLLGDCFRRGWLILDFRKPIGEEVEFSTIDGRNYYIIRAFRR